MTMLCQVSIYEGNAVLPQYRFRNIMHFIVASKSFWHCSVPSTCISIDSLLTWSFCNTIYIIYVYCTVLFRTHECKMMAAGFMAIVRLSEVNTPLTLKYLSPLQKKVTFLGRRSSLYLWSVRSRCEVDMLPPGAPPGWNAPGLRAPPSIMLAGMTSLAIECQAESVRKVINYPESGKIT